MKALHRESCCQALALSADQSGNNMSRSENRLLWRANIQRLDAEALRDSLFFVQVSWIGRRPSAKTDDDGNRRRTIYGFVVATNWTVLSLFDFPNQYHQRGKRD